MFRHSLRQQSFPVYRRHVPAWQRRKQGIFVCHRKKARIKPATEVHENCRLEGESIRKPVHTNEVLVIRVPSNFLNQCTIRKALTFLNDQSTESDTQREGLASFVRRKKRRIRFFQTCPINGICKSDPFILFIQRCSTALFEIKNRNLVLGRRFIPDGLPRIYQQTQSY